MISPFPPPMSCLPFLSRCTFFKRELLCMLCTQNRNMILCNFQAVLKTELLIKKHLNIHKNYLKVFLKWNSILFVYIFVVMNICNLYNVVGIVNFCVGMFYVGYYVSRCFDTIISLYNSLFIQWRYFILMLLLCTSYHSLKHVKCP